MYIVAAHKIKDSKMFWEKAQNGMPDLPANIKLHQVLPNQNGSKVVYLWEADNIKDVKEYVESEIGKYSMNTFYSVGTSNAVGLPDSMKETGFKK